jgi:hypothetical protein
LFEQGEDIVPLTSTTTRSGISGQAAHGFACREPVMTCTVFPPVAPLVKGRVARAAAGYRGLKIGGVLASSGSVPGESQPVAM